MDNTIGNNHVHQWTLASYDTTTAHVSVALDALPVTGNPISTVTPIPITYNSQLYPNYATSAAPNPAVVPGGSISAPTAPSSSSFVLTVPGPNGRRKRARIPDEEKEADYAAKRARNNEAARKSRLKRRMKESSLDGRVAELEAEKGKMAEELAAATERIRVLEETNAVLLDRNSEILQLLSKGQGGRF